MPIELHHSYPEVKTLFEKPEELQRLLFYHRGLPSFHVYRCEVEGDKKWYSVSKYIFGYGKKLFYRQTEVSGLTYENKKVHIWFKGKLRILLNDVFFQAFLEKMNLHWFKEALVKHAYRGMITKTVLEKIFSGKITNTDELITHWIKYSWKRKDVDIELVKGAIKVGNFDPGIVKYVGSSYNKPNEYLQALIFGDYYYFCGRLPDLCNVLGIKLNYKDHFGNAEEIEELSKKYDKRVKELYKKYSIQPYSNHF